MHNPHTKIDDQEILYTLDVPEGVIKEEINHDLFIITWANNIFDTNIVGNSLMCREEWIYKNFDFEILHGYNKLGDKNIKYLENCEIEDSYFYFYNDITDNRTDAIHLNSIVKTIGIHSAVYYDNGTYWNPAPYGNWRE